MENIKILYYHHIENYFEFIFDYYDFEILEGLKDNIEDSIDTEVLKKIRNKICYRLRFSKSTSKNSR